MIERRAALVVLAVGLFATCGLAVAMPIDRGATLEIALAATPSSASTPATPAAPAASAPPRSPYTSGSEASFGSASDAAARAPSAPVATSCPPEPAPIAADDVPALQRAAQDSGFLWRVTRAGRTSWLYGTIHVAERDWVFPGPHVVEALKASDEVALELDPTDPDVTARSMALLARLPGAADLPGDLQHRLLTHAGAACIQSRIAMSVRPELLAVQLEIMVGRRLGLQPAYGVDVMLAGAAHAAGKPLRSLESPEEQMKLLVSDDPKETQRRVIEALDDIDSGDAVRVLQRMAGDWRHGDLADLERYASWCECEKTAEQRDLLRRVVDDRNVGMAERVAQWHGQGHALFVAVGALHLIGPHGVPALLQRKGFVVERVALPVAH